MNKFISRLSALLTAAGLAGITTLTAGAASENLVVLGDSITSGYGLPGYVSGDNYSAADSFANRLAPDFAEYRNFAVDGRTTGELLTALDDPDVSAALADADVTLISIGGNDFLQPMISVIIELVNENEDMLQSFQNGATFDISTINEDNYLDVMREFTLAMTTAASSVDTAKIGQNLRDILAGINSASPECRTVVLTVYNPFEGVPGMEMFDVIAREKLAELNAEITAAAAEYDAEVADVYTAFKGHSSDYTNISSMDIHPNTDGHAVIYSLLSEMLVPAAETFRPVDSPDAAASKGSPDTGIEGIAVFTGIAIIGAAGAVFSRKK